MFEALSSRLAAITDRMRGQTRVTEQDLKQMTREIRLALLEADVNYQVVKDLIADLTERCRGIEVLSSLSPGQQVVKEVRSAMTEILSAGDSRLHYHSSGFTCIMLYGLQGSGKTTMAAKLARYLKREGKRPLLCSVDVHRPAAMKQLAVLAEQIDVPVYIEPENSDATQIAKAALDRAHYLMNDILIVDTAGRMTIDESLMQELEAVADIVQPQEKLLVVDAMIGQEAVNIALAFEEQIGLDGYIMTKMDGDARGGAALSIARMTGKSIKFIGTGEKLEAIDQYEPQRMADRILGMGDTLGLIDKVVREIDQEKAAEAAQRLMSNEFDMNDLLAQFEQIKKMGSLKDIIGLLPGAARKQMGQVDVDDRVIDRQIAMIRSMTPRERQRPRILDASRRKRIAKGAGVSLQDLNQLLRQYEQMSKMMKQMGMMAGGKSGKKGRKRPNMAQLNRIAKMMKDGNLPDLENLGQGDGNFPSSLSNMGNLPFLPKKGPFGK